MAIDAYLQIEGIKGESTDDKQGNTSGGWDCAANKIC